MTNNMSRFKDKVMKDQGYEDPKEAKFEVAKEHGVPLKSGYNGNLTAKQAGTVGGHIGGPMVHELIKMGQQALLNKK